MSRSMKRFAFFRIYLFVTFLHMSIFPASCFRQRTYMAQGLVNGYTRLELTHVCSLNGFQLVRGLY